MNAETFNYIYDALCWAMDLMEDLEIDHKYQNQYDKLNKAAGMLYTWFHMQTFK